MKAIKLNSMVAKRISALLLSVMLICMACLTVSAKENNQSNIQLAGNTTLRWPVPGHTTLSQGYHDGGAIDISDGSIGGANVVAAMSGTVTQIWMCGRQHSGSYGDCNGFGTGLVIYGDDGRFYKYAHMQAGSIPTNAYRTCRVEAGQVIGKVGTTGNSTGNHLHFGISVGAWYNQSGINPNNETYTGKYSTPSVSVSFVGDRCEWDTTNAFVYTKLSASSSGRFTGAGLRVWDMNNNLVAQKDESTSYSSSYMEIYYNIYNETGVSLKEGTRYKYQMYGVFNGATYWTSVKTFTTKSRCDSSHKYTTTVTKATKSSNGKKVTKCSVCGYVSKTTTVYKANNIKIGYTSTVYNGSVKTPSVTVKDSKGNVLKKGTDYTLSYPSGRKNVGRYKIKVTLKGNYSGTSYLYFNIVPKSTTIKKIANYRNSFRVYWNTQKWGASGYQIRYSKNKNFTNSAYKTVSNNSSSSLKVSGLNRKTTYYVKIRTYKTVTVDGKSIRLYSSWSNAKAVRTK